MATGRHARICFCLAAVICSVLIAGPLAAESIFNTENGYGVSNNPPNPARFTLTEPKIITYIRTYHWNYGSGAPAGTISLVKDGKVVYSSPAGIYSKYYWTVQPNLVFPAGTYTIQDSAPATWAHNSQSGGRGFASVNADPVPDDQKGPVTSFFSPAAGGDQKGPVSLSAVPRAPEPNLTVDNPYPKIGDTITLKLVNPPVPSNPGDLFWVASNNQRTMGLTYGQCGGQPPTCVYRFYINQPVTTDFTVILATQQGTAYRQFGPVRVTTSQ
jgi:hypothetical protein